MSATCPRCNSFDQEIVEYDFPVIESQMAVGSVTKKNASANKDGIGEPQAETKRLPFIFIPIIIAFSAVAIFSAIRGDLFSPVFFIALIVVTSIIWLMIYNAFEEDNKQQQLRAEQLIMYELQREKLESEARERERFEREQLERVRLKQEQVRVEQLKKAKIQRDKLEREAQERERFERKRLEQEKLELARLEKERLAALWAEFKAAKPVIRETARKIRGILADGYLRSSQWQAIRSLSRGCLVGLPAHPLPWMLDGPISKDFELIRQAAELEQRKVELIRNTYVSRMKSIHREFFDTVESNPLTEMQRDACVVDEDHNLVLAGAGTGKTSTMIGRTGFLLASQQAKPSDLLLLAFGNKAAKELQERLDNRLGQVGVLASTFHSLGLKIISAVERAKPSLSPLAEDPRRLAQQVTQWFEHFMTIPQYKSRMLSYFEYYLYPVANSLDFETEGEYFEYIKSNEIRTLNNEKVKSLEECLIANHLLRLGVAYEYEANYEYETRTLDYRQYKPDFYLTDFGIYIEHVGTDRQGNTAPFVDRNSYTRSMEWKRELHVEHGTQLIETYSYEQMEGTLLSNLEVKLRRAGVKFSPISTEEMLKKLTGSGAITKIAELLTELLKNYRANRYSADEIAQIIDKSLDPKMMRSAMDLLKPIMDRYVAYLAERREIDFDDMIARATEYVVRGLFRPKWRYLLVDEFQDISAPRARLIKAIIKANPGCSFFCVGDDWQSIFRFTGSDIGFTTDFQKHFGATIVTKLDYTFRFNDSICDVASRFILQNPSQINKKLTTQNKVSKPAISLIRAAGENRQQNSKVDERILKALSVIETKSKRNRTVFVLGRYGFSLPVYGVQQKIKNRFSSLKLEFLTFHKSKGMEADFVIIIGLVNGTNGFPSKKLTHPLLEAMLPDPGKFRFAEERRLFYVALTRARERVYLITDMSETSEFLAELIENKYPLEFHEFETASEQVLFKNLSCPKCKTGSLTIRNGPHGTFAGCSNFPLCDYKESSCENCGCLMKRDGRFRVCTDPRCGNWVPVCPRCGGDMIERTGDYSNFWGCRNYRGDQPVSCRYKEQNIEFQTRVRDDIDLAKKYF